MMGGRKGGREGGSDIKFNAALGLTGAVLSDNLTSTNSFIV